MSSDAGLHSETPEELFEDAPCGYLSTELDGTIVRVNRTFEAMTGLAREDLLADIRFQELLSPGGQIYHETHYAPLLRMQGSVKEIAVEIVCGDGSRLPVLINSVLCAGDDGTPRSIRTTVFDATDRRSYERELLEAQRREHGIAHLLQRSLLAGDLPDVAGLTLDVSYHPAVAALEVGGDWYDAFQLDDSGATVGLVVGDVVGRGIEAAATMGQLRSAVRALASTGLTPAGVLEGLDSYAARHDVGRMTTLVYAQLNLATRELRYACAGHPPPLVVDAGGEVVELWEGRSVPLDVHLGKAPVRADACLTLEPESMVLLYTDGLIERRSSTLTHGIERLRSAVRAHQDTPTGELAEALFRALHDSEHADDVCVLVASITG